MTVTVKQLRTYQADPTQLIAEQLVLTNGKPYGQCWADFQIEAFDAVFANRSDGRPKHRLTYLERRRGESKTEDLAAIALADLLTGPPRHTSFAVAADEDQAALIRESIEGFCSRSPVLADVMVQRDLVRNVATDSSLRILAADARTNFGLRPRLCLFDEMSQQRDKKLWVAMWTSIAKSPASRMVVASMAGIDFSSIAWEVRQMAANSSSYFFQSREGSQPAPWLALEDIEEMRTSLHPVDFAVFFEARWTDAEGAWISSEMWSAVETGTESAGLPFPVQAVGFVDLGLRGDKTAVAVCHIVRGEDGEPVVKLDTLRTLRGTKVAPVQLDAVEDLCAELTTTYRVRHWTFETWQGAASVQALRRRLPGVQIDEYFPTATSQATLFGSLYQLISTRRIIVYPHPELRQESLHLVTKTVGGRMKVVDSGVVHQDCVVAVAGCAMVLLAQPHLTKETIASVRGLIEELGSPSTGGGSRFGSVIGIPGATFGLDRIDR